MKLRIVGHPAQRMVQRGVTREDIVHALTNHHTWYQDDRQQSFTYVGPGLDGRDLKVWTLPPGVVDELTTVTIKSVAWKDQEG